MSGCKFIMLREFRNSEYLLQVLAATITRWPYYCTVNFKQQSKNAFVFYGVLSRAVEFQFMITVKGTPYACAYPTDLCVSGSQTKVAKGAFGLKWHLRRQFSYLELSPCSRYCVWYVYILLWPSSSIEQLKSVHHVLSKIVIEGVRRKRWEV